MIDLDANSGGIREEVARLRHDLYDLRDPLALVRTRVALEDVLREVLGRSTGVFCFTSGAAENAVMAVHAASYRGLATRGTLLDEPYVLGHLSETDTPAVILPDGQLSPTVAEITSRVRILQFFTVANAEYGIVTDPAELIPRIKAGHAENLVYVDLTQALGRLRLDPPEADYLGLDLSIIGGPPMGVLWARSPELLDTPSLFTGVRPGITRHTAADYAAATLSLHLLDLTADTGAMTTTRQQLDDLVLQIPGVRLNFAEMPLLGNTSNYFVDGVDAVVLCRGLAHAGVLTSTGSSYLEDSTMCSALTAFSFSAERRYSNIRFSTRPTTTRHEIISAARRLSHAVTLCRNL